ncbi:MAG: PAS domain-containing protein, partial [Deltaproteobacteria bacterium]|nr:PAS domain-containing protein [Deltaproteobacteria bacterium]
MPNYDEQFLTRVFDSVTDLFAIYDRDFRILRANKALATLFKLSRHQIVGKYCYRIFYNRTAICPECHVEKTFLTGEPQIREKQIPNPDGGHGIFEIHSYPIKDDNGRTIQTVEYIRDITERKSLESQLLASKVFNEKVLNSITDSLIVLDPKTRRIIQANESFCSRVGLEPSVIKTKRCHEIMRKSPTPCEANGIKCPVQDTINSKRWSLSDRVYPDTSGRDRIMQIATYPIFDDKGKIKSIIRLERDVTEKRKMTDALAFRSKELQRAQHQLEKLFEISRQVNAKNSLWEIVDYVHEIAGEIFTNSDPILFLLDAGGQNFLNLEGCNPSVTELLEQTKQELEKAGLIPDFVQYLQRVKKTRIIGSEYSNGLPVFFKFIPRNYSNWFGLPISTPQQCIGYFVLASPDPQEYSREDTHFFLTLFNQIAGHIRHLVTHETEINDLRQRVVERTSHGKIIGQSDE